MNDGRLHLRSSSTSGQAAWTVARMLVRIGCAQSGVLAMYASIFLFRGMGPGLGREGICGLFRDAKGGSQGREIPEGAKFRTSREARPAASIAPQLRASS